jgi:hypothetical protein
MGEVKLKIGVNWHGALKQKRGVGTDGINP